MRTFRLPAARQIIARDFANRDTTPLFPQGPVHLEVTRCQELWEASSIRGVRASTSPLTWGQADDAALPPHPPTPAFPFIFYQHWFHWAAWRGFLPTRKRKRAPKLWPADRKDAIGMGARHKWDTEFAVDSPPPADFCLKEGSWT